MKEKKGLGVQQQEEAADAFRKQREAELKLKSLLNTLFTPEAASRLNNIKLSNEELFQQIVQLVASLYQRGQFRSKITEEQVKSIVAKLLEQRKPTSIKFMRK